MPTWNWVISVSLECFVYDEYDAAAYIDLLKDAIYSLAILILEASKDAFEIHAIVAYLKYLPTCWAHY